MGKKTRMIILKYLNWYLWKDNFKYKGTKEALMYFEKGDSICTFDLKSGYCHVDIHPSLQTYVGFKWKGSSYMLCSLCCHLV